MNIEVNSKEWLSLQDLPSEEWRDIKGYEGLYQVSNLGRVKSLGRERYPMRIMKAHTDTKGYLDIELSNGYKHRHRIHRLVAQAFIPNVDNKPQVNHKDCNKKNNCLSNLEWCTNGENQQHAFYNGLNHRERYGASPRAKRVKQYDLNGNFIREWDSIVRIREECGYSDTFISQCCGGKYKRAYGYIWKYSKEN